MSTWEEFENNKRESAKRQKQLHWMHVSPEDWFTIFESFASLVGHETLVFEENFPGKVLKISEFKIQFQIVKLNSVTDKNWDAINIVEKTKGKFTCHSFQPGS